jgi:hypothetical protein
MDLSLLSLNTNGNFRYLKPAEENINGIGFRVSVGIKF